MHIFIDESGVFLAPPRPKPRVCCVAALVVGDAVVNDLLADFVQLRDSWAAGRGEIKGSTLQEEQVAQVIALAVRYDALLEICAVDTGRTLDADVSAAKVEQADALRASVNEREFHPNVVRWMNDLADRWERLSNPLMIQLFATVHVAKQVLHEAPTYYAQRTPRELAAFHWVLDRKDRQLTPYEELWMELVCPFLQTESLSDPFALVEGLDYSHMERFRIGTDRFPHLHRLIDEYSHARGKPRPATAWNVKMLLQESVAFEDSAERPGLQLVDVLGNAFSRAMNANLRTDGWGEMGRLMIAAVREAPAAFVGIYPRSVEPIPVTGRQRRIMVQLKRKTKPMIPG